MNLAVSAAAHPEATGLAPGAPRAVSPAWPRLEHIWGLLPAASAFAFCATLPIHHSDLFYMLLNGRLMAEQGQFPVAGDPFTYAPADPLFFNQPWLAQLLFWAAERAAGMPGVILAHAAAIAAAIGLLTWLLRREGARPPLAALLAAVAFFVATANLTVRPQSFAIPLFVLCLAVLRTGRPGSARAAAGMGVLCVAWANLHGSFTLGVALSGLHLLGSLVETRRLRHPAVRHYGLLTAAALAGTLLNPAGPLVWWYALRAGSDPTNRLIILEWLPPTLDSLGGRLWLIGGIVLLAILLAHRRVPRATDLLLLLGFGALAFSMQRAIIWWGLLAPVVVAHAVSARYMTDVSSAPGRRREVAVLNGALLAGLALAVALSLPWLRPVHPLLPPHQRALLSPDHPVGAADYLAARGAQGRLFARMEWGGYLAWRLWPDLRVFLDARIEQHPPAVWLDYHTVLQGEPGWDGLLDGYETDYLLLERAPFQRLSALADDHPHWRRVYEDELSVLYARQR